MTPTIITAGTLARAAEDEIAARSAGSGTELHLATASRRFRRAAAEVGRDLFHRGGVVSHLPEESPQQFTWRLDRERYRVASHSHARPTQEEGMPTRAAGRAGHGRRSHDSAAPHSWPSLSLSYSIRAREGVSVGIADRSELMERIDTDIDRARYHLSRSRDLIAASRRRGLSRDERRARVVQAVDHYRQALSLRDAVADSSEGLLPGVLARVERFTGHAAWSTIGASLTTARERSGIS